MKRSTVLIGMLLVMLFVSVRCTGQSMRDPTPAERTVLMSVINAINKEVELFENADWQITRKFNEEELDVPNGAKDQVRAGYSITIKRKDITSLYTYTLAQAERLTKENKQDSLDGLYDRMEKLAVIHIDIDINSESANLGSAPRDNIALKLLGPSKTYIVAQDDVNPSENGAYMLIFGHWKDASIDLDNGCYRFHFNHPPQTPFVENVVIKINGNNKRIAAVLKSTDWHNVAAGMMN